MNRHEDSRKSSADTDLIRKVGADSARKIRLKQSGADKTWFGMGLMGLVGWSIAVPALSGLLVGIWIDQRWPMRVSWTMMLLVAGIGLGCLNVWYWLGRQEDEMDLESGQPDRKERKKKGRS